MPRRLTYRVDVSPDLYKRIEEQAKASRPRATVRACCEMLLWDALNAASYRASLPPADERARPEPEPEADEPMPPPRRGNLNEPQEA